MSLVGFLYCYCFDTDVLQCVAPFLCPPIWFSCTSASKRAFFLTLSLVNNNNKKNETGKSDYKKPCWITITVLTCRALRKEAKIVIHLSKNLTYKIEEKKNIIWCRWTRIICSIQGHVFVFTCMSERRTCLPLRKTFIDGKVGSFPPSTKVRFRNLHHWN